MRLRTLQLRRHDDDSEFGKSTGSAAYGYAFAPGAPRPRRARRFGRPRCTQRFSMYGDATLQPETSRKR